MRVMTPSPNVPLYLPAMGAYTPYLAAYFKQQEMFIRDRFIVASTLVTASAVSMCGQVGWIGLLIPHASRMLVGSNNRYVVPLSLSLGASFMILIDTLSRSISIIELPLSILTAIIGAPAFISLLNKTRSNLQ